MSDLAFAIAPVFVLVILGNLLRRAGIVEESFWKHGARLGYWVLIPALLFYKLSTAEIDIGLMVPFAITLCGAFFIVGAIVLVITRWLRTPAPARGSALQGAVRHNSFMALALAENLYGTEGLSLAALASAVLAMVTNLSIVPALLMMKEDRGERSMLKQALRDLVQNPFILSITAGLAVNFLVPGRIPILHDTTAMLGAVALPLMLLCVGAGLKVRGLRAGIAPLGLSVFGRFVLFPFFVLLMPFGLGFQEMMILLLFAAVPTAPSSVALASETGGDVPVMNAIITIQTAMAFFTIPLTLAIGAMVLG